MSKFAITITAIVVAFVGIVYFAKSDRPKEPTIGNQHANLGQQHLNSIDAKHAAYNSQLPSSGSHYVQPAPWGIKSETVPDEQLIHNEEHGGVVITYKPDLPQDQIAKLQQIAKTVTAVDSPSSIKGFKVLMFPRAKNNKPIELASWTYTLDLDQVNEQTIKTFYRQHLNKSPEPSAS
jgi:hypothetical protein